MFKRKNNKPAVGSGYSEGGGDIRNIWRDDSMTSTYSIYVTGSIHNDEHHNERIDLIRTAKDGDVIYLYLTTPGGEIDIAEGYCDAIQTTEAHVITRAVGLVASAGTLIWLAGHEKEIADRSAFMFHNAKGGCDYEDIKNIAHMADFFARLYEDNFRDIYSSVLTPDELDIVFSGREVYIRGTEMLRRIQGVENKPLISKETPVEKEERAITITLADGSYSKTIKLDGISVEDFHEFNAAELKGVLLSLGMSGDELYGERSVDVLAQKLIASIKKATGW